MENGVRLVHYSMLKSFYVHLAYHMNYIENLLVRNNKGGDNMGCRGKKGKKNNET